MFKPFNATVVGSVDFVEVHVEQAYAEDGEPIAAMAVLTPIMEVHITKEQAMQFFGLVSPA